jgi:DNA-binding transcriptional ArsR family regulator
MLSTRKKSRRLRLAVARQTVLSGCPGCDTNMPARQKTTMTADQLAAIGRLFAVLSEASRLALLQALHDGPRTVNELVEACAMKQANVSKQLAILHDHRLVKRQRQGTSIRYEIADPMVFSLCNLVCGKMAKDAQNAVAVFHPEI